MSSVVGGKGESQFCGFHPRGLSALLVDDLERRARRKLRRKRDVPTDRLRDGEFGRYLIRCWEEMVGRVDWLGGGKS